MGAAQTSQGLAGVCLPVVWRGPECIFMTHLAGLRFVLCDINQGPNR